MKIELIPAILPYDFTELEDKISLVNGFVRTVQIDVCDGQFTPEPSWPYRKRDDTFEALVREERGLPNWETLNFEIDLMINHPETAIDSWISAGASRLIIHAESKGDIAGAVTNASGRVETGIAINTDTPVSTIEPYTNKIQFIQCMGINRIGYQGQPFDRRVLDRVREVRAIYPDMPISVDGGVSVETASDLIEAGATRLVEGSAIFTADNVIEAIRNFSSLMH